MSLHEFVAFVASMLHSRRLLIDPFLVCVACSNFQVRSQWPVYHEIAQYAPDDAPADYAPGNGRSYIDVSALKLSVVRKNQLFFWICVEFGGDQIPDNHLHVCVPGDQYCEQSPSRTTLCPNSTQFEISLFKKPTLDDKWLGYWDNHQYCCTESALNAGLCTDLGQLIIPEQIHGTVSTAHSVARKAAHALWVECGQSGSPSWWMSRTSQPEWTPRQRRLSPRCALLVSDRGENPPLACLTGEL
jgi:hypothetical protein